MAHEFIFWLHRRPDVKEIYRRVEGFHKTSTDLADWLNSLQDGRDTEKKVLSSHNQNKLYFTKHEPSSML